MIPFVKECNFCHGNGKAVEAVFPKINHNLFTEEPSIFDCGIKEEVIDCPICNGKGHININTGKGITKREILFYNQMLNI